MKIIIPLTLLTLLFAFTAGAILYFNGIHPDKIIALFSKDKSDSLSIANNRDSEKNVTGKSPYENTYKNALNKNTSSEVVNENSSLLPLPKNPYESIDKHALNCPKSEEKSIESIANYLQLKALSDIEKARAIYIWITKNISYDDNGYNSKNYGDCSAVGVLKSRASVCEGYSNLFLALGEKMNLEIKKISGYAKGYSYKGSFSKPDHAWNIIKIDGQWRIFDATWGSGFGNNVNGKLVSSKKFTNFWFNTSPFVAIFTHFPVNKLEQYIKPELDLRTYISFPIIDNYYFELGNDPVEAYSSLYHNRTLVFPNCYQAETYVKANKVPKYKNLILKKSYSFEFYIPRGIKAAIYNSKNEWTYFSSKDGVFSLEYTPQIAGDISICILYENEHNSYSTIMVYSAK